MKNEFAEFWVILYALVLVAYLAHMYHVSSLFQAVRKSIYLLVLSNQIGGEM